MEVSCYLTFVVLLLAFVYGWACPHPRFIERHLCRNGRYKHLGQIGDMEVCGLLLAERAAKTSNSLTRRGEHPKPYVHIFEDEVDWFYSEKYKTCSACEEWVKAFKCTGDPPGTPCKRRGMKSDQCNCEVVMCWWARHDPDSGHFLNSCHTMAQYNYYKSRERNPNGELRLRKRRDVYCPVKEKEMEKNKCFPGEATVLLHDNTLRRMADLKSGDVVATVNERGELVYSDVYAFAVRQVDGDYHYHRLYTMDGTYLELSSTHHVYVRSSNNTANQLTLKKASDVRIGEYLHVLEGDGQRKMRSIQIVGIDLTERKGAYAPLTKTGTIMVNGVAASCYGKYPLIQHLMRAPIRVYYNLLKYVGVPTGDMDLTRENDWFSWIVENLNPKSMGDFFVHLVIWS